MMVLQMPQLPKPEDVLNAFQRAGAQGLQGLFMTLSAPIEIIKGLGLPVPELPQPPTTGKKIIKPMTPALMALPPLPFISYGGEEDVTYEPYEGETETVGGSEDVTIEVEKKKEIWV